MTSAENKIFFDYNVTREKNINNSICTVFDVLSKYVVEFNVTLSFPEAIVTNSILALLILRLTEYKPYEKRENSFDNKLTRKVLCYQFCFREKIIGLSEKKTAIRLILTKDDLKTYNSSMCRSIGLKFLQYMKKKQSPVITQNFSFSSCFVQEKFTFSVHKTNFIIGFNRN